MRFLITLSLSIFCAALNAQTFTIVSGTFTWQDAKADAESRGGRLAVLNTQEKINAANNYLGALSTGWPYLWIGLTDEIEQNAWRWVNGQNLTDNNWRTSEPSPGDERYGEIISSNSPDGPSWNNEGGHVEQGYLLELQFQVIRGNYTWAEATADAAARGGRLAVLNTQEKIDVATALVRSDTSPSSHSGNLLIGLRRSDNDNNFYWSTGEPLGVQNWDANQPENGGEEAVVISVEGGRNDERWHDVPLLNRYDYLLEIVPPDTDSDSDGVPDSLEITEGTDPNDAGSYNSFSTGLVAYYPFNGNANDESVYSNDGTVYGASLGPDRNGVANSSYSFDGSDDYIDMGDKSIFDAGDASSSYSYWFKTNGSQVNKYILSKYETYATNSFGLGTAHNSVAYSFYIGDIHIPNSPEYNAEYKSESSTNDGNWHNFIVTVDKDLEVLTTFLDGIKKEEISISDITGGIDNNFPLLVGKIVDGQNFGGDIDDIRIYNRALSAQEAAALYSTESGRYRVINGDFTWPEARADAESRGGRLAVLNSQEKVIAASSIIPKRSDGTNIALIGGYRIGSELFWIDGSSVNIGLFDWTEGNPESELYMAVTSDSKLLDISLDDTYAENNQGYLLEIIPPTPLAPVLELETFYESSSGESITIDATPADGYPTTYTYQWSFKAIGSTNYFLISATFGGTAAYYPIDSDTTNDGTWKVEVTNDAGTTEAQFEYRVFADSDGDGLSDGREEFVLGTDPLKEDTDSDGLLDGVESNTGIWVSATDTGTDPLNEDSDTDGLLDGVETNTSIWISTTDTGTDPLNEDSDTDGLLDGVESNTGIWVSATDTGTDPLNEDSDTDGLLDGVESNTSIWISTTDTGTDPNSIDSDGDTLLDGVETYSGTFVGLSDTGTNPNSTDSDADGFSDDFEVNTGYDPTSPANTPDSLIVIRTAVELDIYTAIGGEYRIEYTDAIESDVWITAEEDIIGNGDIIRRLYNTREYSDRFYRAIRTDQ
jgi:hypothetical protein